MKKFFKNFFALFFVIFGVLFTILGFISGYSSEAYFSGTIIGVIGIILVFLGIKIFKIKPKFISNKTDYATKEVITSTPTVKNPEIKKNETVYVEKRPDSVPTPTHLSLNKNIDLIETYVAGLGFENRRKNLKKMVDTLVQNDYIEANYDGYTNKEIKDEYYEPDKKYWRIVDEAIPYTFLIPEPTNEFDPNAIRVEINDEEDKSSAIVVGYLKKSIAKKVKKYLDDGYNISCDSIIQGGKYKYLDYDDYGEEKVLIDEIDYYLVLEITVTK